MDAAAPPMHPAVRIPTIVAAIAVLAAIPLGGMPVPRATAQYDPCDRALPEPGPGVGKELRIVGQIGGASYAVAVDGSLVLLAVGPRVLAVDVASPAEPRLLGQSQVLGGIVRDVAIADGLAYVAAGQAGLVVLDVSDVQSANPAQMPVVGAYVGPAQATSLLVRNDLVYLTDDGVAGRGQVWVFDVSSPDRPAVISQFDVPYVEHVAASAEHLFLTKSGAVQVYSLADPRQPSLIATSTEGGVVAAAEGQWLYALDKGALSVVDILDPALPHLVAELRLPGEAHGMTVVGDLAYVVGGPAPGDAVGPRSGWLTIVDLAALRDAAPGMGSASSPVRATFANIASDVVVADGRAYVAELLDGLGIFNAPAGGIPTRAGMLPTVGVVRDAAVRGEFALALTRSHLTSVDVSDPSRLEFRDRWAAAGFDYVSTNGDFALGTPSGVMDLAFVSRHLQGDNTLVAEVRPSGDLTAYGSIPAGDFAAAATHVYVQQFGLNAGLHVYEIMLPGGPKDVMRVAQIRDNPRAVVGTTLYTTDDTPGAAPSDLHLTALSVVNPRRPTETGTVAIAGLDATNSAFTYTRAFFEDPRSVLEARAVALGGNMRLGSGRIPIPGGCTDFAASGTSLWTARSEAAVFDVSDIDSPRLVAKVPLPAKAHAIAANGDVGYVADGEGGLVVVSLEDRPPPTPTTPPTPSATPTAVATARHQARAIYLPRTLITRDERAAEDGHLPGRALVGRRSPGPGASARP